MLATKTSYEEYHGAEPDINYYAELCVNCGSELDSEFEHAEIYGGEHICDDCVETWDIEDLRSFLNYNSTFEILQALNKVG